MSAAKWSTSRGTKYPERDGMKDAIERARHGRSVKPTEADAPPLVTFPGPKEKRLEGQLSLADLHSPELASRQRERESVNGTPGRALKERHSL